MSCSRSKVEPIFTTARTTSSCKIQEGIYEIKLEYEAPATCLPVRPGQFFMLRREPSQVLLARPISVYWAKKIATSQNGKETWQLTFLILLKGQGTQELCSVTEGDKIALIGPLGNTFPTPEPSEKLCVVGGGIGVAPVAGFAASLPAKSYDFYAGFKTGSYGLEKIQAAKLVVTSDDGSCGVKGMIPQVLDADTLKEEGYKAVYACGPEPLLAYIKKICGQAAIPCYLSMESAMACGMGACLGCTIATTEGNKRCCAEGPVFPGEILLFPEKKAPAKPATKPSVEVCSDSKTTAASLGGGTPPRSAGSQSSFGGQPDLSVTIAGVKFANPVIAASGTFGYGNEYESILEVNRLGGICSKGLTYEGRPGNGGVRLKETAGGIINSIGLENPGIPHFVEHQLAQMKKLAPVTIANLSGSTIESYVEGAKLLAQAAVPMIELNISCPNVKAGGMAFGLECNAAASVTAAVREAAPKVPLMVKLSPNAPDLIAVADSVRKAGADAISLINTVQAMSIDINTGRPLFDNIRAGLSGPAVKPIALRMVYDLVQYMNKLPEQERIPVVGLGGISCWQDAVEFIMAGASAIQVGTATFANPRCMTEIIDGLATFMKERGYQSLEDFRGLAQAQLAEHIELATTINQRKDVPSSAYIPFEDVLKKAGLSTDEL